MMHGRWLTFPPLLLFGILCGCDIEDFASSDRYQADFHESRAFPAGGRLYLENFNGSVDISGWDEKTAEISGTKYASRESVLDALKIDVVVSGDSLRVRTIRPSGHSGNMGARYTIRVPREASIERVESSNGSIRVRDISGPLRLETSNGAVELDSVGGPVVLRTSNGRIRANAVRQALDATTSNGGITAVLDEVEPGQRIRLQTSNGGIELSLDRLQGNEVELSTSNSSITLRLPAGFSARIKARTSNGRITNEFEHAFQGRMEKTFMEGTLGSGGSTTITLRTSNGSIRLLRR